MADVDEVDVQDVDGFADDAIDEPVDEPVDEGLDDDEDIDEEADEESDESLEDLYESEVVGDRQATEGPIEDEDELIVKAMEATDDEPSETLSVKVSGKTEGEFLCQSCFLIKRPTQLADAKNMLCVDCA